MHDVYIPKDNYDILHNSKVKAKYPALYKAVKQHDALIPRNSWYDLSDEAYAQYMEYIGDDEIGYVI